MPSEPGPPGASPTPPAAGDLLDLERGLPTTPEDVAALQRLRYPRLDARTYGEWLRQFGDLPVEELRRRKGPRGEPFTL